MANVLVRAEQVIAASDRDFTGSVFHQERFHDRLREVSQGKYARFYERIEHSFELACAYMAARRSGGSDLDCVATAIQVYQRRKICGSLSWFIGVNCLVLSVAAESLPNHMEKHDPEWFEQAFRAAWINSSENPKDHAGQFGTPVAKID